HLSEFLGEAVHHFQQYSDTSCLFCGGKGSDAFRIPLARQPYYFFLQRFCFGGEREEFASCVTWVSHPLYELVFLHGVEHACYGCLVATEPLTDFLLVDAIPIP